MSKKEHNQCRYCKHYKAYDFHGFDGEKIYACERELSRNPCIFQLSEDIFTRKEELSKEESEWLIDFITKEGGAE